MPTSTLLQLVARGRQDAYLTGNPQTTFFKHVYRRYTPFAIESIPIEFDGTPDFGRRISCILPRKAELLNALFLEVDLPALPPDTTQDPPLQRYWVNDIGHAMIEEVSIEIGDKEIDKHTGAWLQIWSSFTVPADKRTAFNTMIGHSDVFPPTDTSQPHRLIIPLRFWFCNSIGESLPLIALQAHPIRLIIKLAPFQKLWWSTAFGPDPTPGPCPTMDPVAPTRIQLFGDYIFLDNPERQRLAATEHEYLITQLQYSPAQSIPPLVQTANIDLTFNHACTEFIWTIQQNRIADAREWFNYSNRLNAGAGEAGVTLTDPLESAIIRLDGMERFQRRFAPHFRITQPFQRHTVVPAGANDYIYDYSFSLKPEEEQPSGTLNASKIDDIAINMAFPAGQPSAYERTIRVYTQNYNVLRIVGGLGGLAFIA
jgi:hypothetical protein